VNGLLFLAPALLLALVLLTRRFPGERHLAAFAGGRRAGSHRAPARVIAAARPLWPLLPRGSALLAASLATRPPPLALQS
jgi:hypothetical protein